MYFASFMDTTHFGGSKSAKQCLPRLSGRPARNARLDNSTCGLFGGRDRNSIRGGGVINRGKGEGTGLTPVVAATIVSDDDA